MPQVSGPGGMAGNPLPWRSRGGPVRRACRWAAGAEDVNIAMDSKADRKLTLLDCLSLVLAVGVGFGLARFTSGQGAAAGDDLRWKIAAGSWAVAFPITWLLAASG